MKKTIKLTVFVLGLLLVGCKDEFLETFPTSQISAETIAEASAVNPGLQSATVAGIYATMYSAGAGGTTNHEDFGQKSTDIKTDLLSGDMALARKAYSRWAAMSEFLVTTDFTQQHNYREWRYFYKIIFFANNVIDALGGTETVPEGAEARAFMGQALAARGYAYFYLSQLFVNDPSDRAQDALPIYTNAQTPNVEKSSLGDVYDLMIDDLERAVSYLDGFSRGDKSQIDQWVARGILAYAYGAAGDFSAMAATAKTVVDNGPFSLMTASQVVYDGDPNQGGFNDINAMTGAMWGVDLTADQGIGLISFWGQMDIFSYSYQWAGNIKAMDESLFAQIPSNDIRRGQFGSYIVDHVPFNKFYHSGRTNGGQRQVTTDLLYMRVAEMYLLAAEGMAETGQEAQAKTMLKTLVNQRLTAGSDATYIDALSGTALQDEIKLQSRIELWGEGKSYLRVKRQRETITRGNNWLDLPGTSYQYSDEKLTFEIPEAELRDNPLLNDQN